VTEGDQKLLRLEERPGSVLIDLDSGETLEVAPSAVPPDMPGVGGSVSSPLLHALRAAAARKAAARDLFRLLDRKLWTSSRLRRKLHDLGHEDSAVEAVLQRAEEQGLHSDRDFADAFCRDTLRTKAVGRAWLESRLRQKGVPPSLAGDVAARNLPSELETELADAAAERRWRRETGRDQRALARVQRFLASRGFPGGMAARAARAARPEAEPPDSSCISDPEGPS